jgi:hypothetical protein
MQTKIIHTPKTQDRGCWEGRADAVHKRTTRIAEVVGHGGVRSNRSDRVGPAFEILAAANMLQVFIVNGKVGRKHGRCKFPAIYTIADKGVDQARTFGWLETVLERRQPIIMAEREG